jgi:hypothetical protein
MTDSPEQTVDRLQADAIDKINAGAALIFALYQAPGDWIVPLLNTAPRAVIDAYQRASEVYHVDSRVS